MHGRSRYAAFSILVLLGCAPAGLGGPINSNNGLEGLGSFSGTFDYTALTSSTASLEITLDNTSPLANGGFLTAFAFNNPFDRITGVSFSSSNASFGLLGVWPFQNGVSAPPFGDYDIGASTSSIFLGMGNPSTGIGAGSSATFSFSLSGNNLGDLTTADFFSELSSSASSENGPQAFVARFRGFKNGGSDKVPGTLEPGGGVQIQSAPEPSSLALASVALLCLATTRWWRGAMPA